jgi:hypothetical protein
MSTEVIRAFTQRENRSLWAFRFAECTYLVHLAERRVGAFAFDDAVRN